MNFRRGLAAIGILVSAAWASLPASAASGDLDPAFGTGGVSIITTDPMPGSSDNAVAVVRQSSGKIVVVGNSVVVARFTAAGGLDATFGSGGRLYLNPSRTHPLTAYHAIAQPDDRIVLATTSSGPHALIYRLMPDGAPDATFGAGGVVTLDLSGDGIAENVIRRIVRQPDGKLVLAGGSGSGMLVARLNADGTRDTAFGSNGFVVTNAGSGSVLTASAVALQADGRILVGSELRVARLLANGTPDTTLPFGSYLVTSSYVSALASQSDGKLLVAMNGFFGERTVARYTAAGIPDTDAVTGFGPPSGPGRAGVIVPPLTVSEVAESGGSIRLAGSYAEICCSNSLVQNQGAIVRLTADGSLDAAYGTDGLFRTFLPSAVSNANYASWNAALLHAGGGVVVGNFSGDVVVAQADSSGAALAGFGTAGVASADLLARVEMRVNAAARQPDGKIVVAGCYGSGASCDSFVMRLGATGLPDATFGTGGRVVLDLGGNDEVHAMALQPDGRILLAGRATSFDNPHFLVARLTGSGVLDTTFNATGSKVFDLETGMYGEARGIGLQASGKIIVAGSVARVTSQDIGVARLGADGALDATFGTSGVSITDFIAYGTEEARALLVRADDRIVVAGTNGVSPPSRLVVLLGLTPGGALDATFGNANGSPGWRVSQDVGVPTGIVELPGEGLAVGGWSSRPPFYGYPGEDHSWVARLSEAQQNSFLTSNYYESILGPLSRVNGIAKLPDGRLAVAGDIQGTSSRDAKLMRLMPNGATDTYFASAPTDFDDLSQDTGGIPLALPDGKVVTVHNVEPTAFALAQHQGSLIEQTVLTLAANPPTITYGQSVTLTATITGVTAPPAGQLWFVGGYANCSENAVASTATSSTAQCVVQGMGAGTQTVTVYYIPPTSDLTPAQGTVSVTVNEVATGITVAGVAPTLPAPAATLLTVTARDIAGGVVVPGGTYEVGVQKVSGAGSPVALYGSVCNLLGGQSATCSLYLQWSQMESGAQFRLVARSLVEGIPDLPASETFTVDFVKFATASHSSVTGPSQPVAGTSVPYRFVIARGDVPATQATGTVAFSIGGVTVAGCEAVAVGSLPWPSNDFGAVCNAVRRDVAGATTVSASYSGDALYEVANPSLAVQVLPAAAASIAVAGGGGQSVALGTAIAAPLQAVVRDEFGNGVPARPVSFTVPSSGATLIPFNSGQALTGADGIASLGGIAAGAAGAYSVTASTSGVTGTISFAITNTAAAPAVFLTSSNNPAVLGAPIGFTATVLANGEPRPSGTVTFLNGATELGTAALTTASPAATLVVSSLPVGAYTITARFDGAGWATATSNPVSQTVNPASAGVSVSSSANPSTFGGPVTFTASVGGTSPAGTVQFRDGTNLLGSPVALASGQASITLSTLGVGLHAVTATYSGDTNNQAATSLPAIQVVNRAMPAFTIVSNLAAAPVGASVTFSVSFASQPSVPTGFVVFRSNGTDFAAAPLVNGVATLSTAALAAGSNTVQAEYSGDGSFEPALSAAVVIPVGPLDPAGDADRDAIPNGVEAAEGRNPLAKDNDIFSPGAGSARLFAMQQYRDFLGREGDPAGIQGWTDLVDGGAYTRNQVIDAFLQSQEFGGFVAPVVRLYFATFLRVPDYAGLAYNAGLVRAGTVTPVQLADFFAASPEFLATYGTLDNAAFVTLLYNNVLGRAPDPAGLSGWVALLSGGMSRGQVLYGFSESAEYTARMGSEVFVTMMYAGMLRRTPEPSGFNGWVGFLDAGTYTREQVINGFFLSTEYRGRFLP